MSTPETDPRLREEYRTSSNVSARVDLYQRFGTNRYGWQKWFFDRLQLPPDARLLELGCGPGTLWLKNSDRIPPGWDVVLSDFSDGMLADARQNLGSIEHAFTFQKVNIQAIPFADGEFDAVIANFMLYHVPDCGLALAELQRVLRPGGRLFSATVGESHLQEIRDLVEDFADPAPRPHFLLEDGESDLERLFSSVTVHRFDNSLVVDEAAPLVDYVMSTKTLEWLEEDRQQDFRRYVESEVARRGPLHITVDAGLFEAVKPSAG